MQGAKVAEELNTLAMRDDISLLLYQAGFGNQCLILANKSEAIQCILFHQVFKSRCDQISDLMDGLNTLGILELLRVNDACLPVVFPLLSDVSISENDVLSNLEYLPNQSAQEQEVSSWFSQYVKYLAEGKAYCPCLGNYLFMSVYPVGHYQHFFPLMIAAFFF